MAAKVCCIHEEEDRQPLLTADYSSSTFRFTAIYEEEEAVFLQDTLEFKQLMTTCDSYYRELREQGIGAAAKSTEVLTDDETEQLWASGVTYELKYA